MKINNYQQLCDFLWERTGKNFRLKRMQGGTIYNKTKTSVIVCEFVDDFRDPYKIYDIKIEWIKHIKMWVVYSDYLDKIGKSHFIGLEDLFSKYHNLHILAVESHVKQLEKEIHNTWE